MRPTTIAEGHPYLLAENRLGLPSESRLFPVITPLACSVDRLRQRLDQLERSFAQESSRSGQRRARTHGTADEKNNRCYTCLTMHHLVWNAIHHTADGGSQGSQRQLIAAARQQASAPNLHIMSRCSSDYLTLSVQRRLAGLVLGDLVHHVLLARLVLAERTLCLWNVHLHLSYLCHSVCFCTCPHVYVCKDATILTMVGSSAKSESERSKGRCSLLSGPLSSLSEASPPQLCLSCARATRPCPWRQADSEACDVIIDRG